MVQDRTIDAEELQSYIDNEEGLYTETEAIYDAIEAGDTRNDADAFENLIDMAVDAYIAMVPGSTMSGNERRNAMQEFSDRYEEERT